MTGFDVTIEELTESHLAAHAALSQTEYGDSAVSNPVHLRWKYLENPQGPSVGVHVVCGGRLVARLVAQPRRFGSSTAAYIVDLLVAREHRSMRMLLTLLEGFKRLRERYAFVLITPNEAGAAVWRDFVKLPEPFALRVSALPLRPAALVGRNLGRASHAVASAVDSAPRTLTRPLAAGIAADARLRLSSTWPNDDELDDLLARASDVSIRGLRDRAFVIWRFRRPPVLRYDAAFIYKEGVLSGYLVTRRTTFRGYDARFFVDAVGAPNLTRWDWSKLAWRMIASELGPGGAELLVSLGTTADGPLLRLSQFSLIPLPSRLFPPGAPVFAEWWSAPAFALASATLEVTLADSDIV